ncbi:hypothetical protein BV210_05395 [Halorientalis sp. IM1011]|uniref:DUF7312 domain-containing protein n=1 Tax=Halorientalis sp. IM1011 TaxID=1932360 RepID=UPI00097CC427|nr:hypothetical protein [Halorientalis sp. IM1011]AQL42180.1 hypothetical protein BV210_05395 [Halorientalis sp. IM1011]
MSEADDEDGGWKFELEDLPGEDDPEGDADDGEGEEGNVAGSMVLEEPLEPGSPSLENTAFVLLGALCTVLLFLVVLGVI